MSGQVVADAPQQIERRVGRADRLADRGRLTAIGNTSPLGSPRDGSSMPGRWSRTRRASAFHFDRRRMIDSVGRGKRSGWWRAMIARGKPASSPTPPATPLRRRPPSGAGALRYWRRREHRRFNRGRRHHGHRDGLASRGCGVLRDSSQAKQGQGPDATEDRGSTRRLGRALTEQFTKEIARSSDRIRTSIAPYSRFVRAEGETLERSELELNDALSAIASLRYRIESAGATVLQS